MNNSKNLSVVAIILGASDFSKVGQCSEPAFEESARAVKRYLLAENGLALARANVLDLFDDVRAPADQNESIDRFLVERTEALAAESKQITDVLVYYTGHGLFADPGAEYALALRFTKESAIRAGSYHVVDLALVLKQRCCHARRFVILDCCFAASAYRSFESGVLGVAAAQVETVLPSSGTALLCASARDRPAKSRLFAGQTRSGLTLFSECLLAVLTDGIAYVSRDRLTLSEVGVAVQRLMNLRYEEEGPRPEVKSPDERRGNVADVPLFPNPLGAAKSAPSTQPAAPGLGDSRSAKSTKTVAPESHSRVHDPILEEPLSEIGAVPGSSARRLKGILGGLAIASSIALLFWAIDRRRDSIGEEVSPPPDEMKAQPDAIKGLRAKPRPNSNHRPASVSSESSPGAPTVASTPGVANAEASLKFWCQQFAADGPRIKLTAEVSSRKIEITSIEPTGFGGPESELGNCLREHARVQTVNLADGEVTMNVKF